MARTAAFPLFSCLLIVSEFTHVTARSLRSKPNGNVHAGVPQAVHMVVQKTISTQLAAQASQPAPAPAPAEVPEALQAAKHDVFKLIEQTYLTAKAMKDCLCPKGTFWHFRIKNCTKQGGLGYECGFFPKEHWHRVCKDGYKCVALDVPDNYVSHGKYEGTSGSAPASCRKCEDADKCKVGQKRHDEECVKKYGVSGEACSTVRVTFPVSAKASVTKEVTVEASQSKEASAKATEKASHTANSTAIATKQIADGKEVTAEGTGSATAEKKATAEATKKVEATAEATGKATATTKAGAEGIAEKKACVAAEEVFKAMDLENGRVGAVLAAKIINQGAEMSFELASKAAIAAAKEAGLLDAKEAAKQLAEAEAAQSAKMKAEALAKQAAGWKAEAGANKAAQAAAEARAKEIAKDKAKLEAERLAHLEAQAEAARRAAEAARAALAKAEKEGKDVDDAKAKVEAADAAVADAEAAAKALRDVLNPPQPGHVVPREETQKPTAYRKITKEQAEEMRP